MDNLTEIEKLRFATKGERLRYLREFAHLDRNEAADIARVAYATYKDWENSKTNLPQTRAYWFVDELRAIGIDCSIEWLMHGIGDSPKKRSVVLFPEISYGSDQIAKELAFFCDNNVGAIGMIIADGTMTPSYAKGDAVGGIQYTAEDINKVIGLGCIVKLESDEILLRNVNKGKDQDHYTLSCSDPESVLCDVKLIAAAPVIWHRKKLSF